MIALMMAASARCSAAAATAMARESLITIVNFFSAITSYQQPGLMVEQREVQVGS